GIQHGAADGCGRSLRMQRWASGSQQTNERAEQKRQRLDSNVARYAKRISARQRILNNPARLSPPAFFLRLKIVDDELKLTHIQIYSGPNFAKLLLTHSKRLLL